MWVGIVEALGGLGLFLVGMLTMTDGLRALAGASLREWIARFTRSPLSGAATGAAATAIVQSSSATVVAAVGFVGAGLLTFPQALGVIFGANIGTTVTGWIAALIGFNVKLGEIAPLLLIVGALLRLRTAPRYRAVGSSLAGFALLFMGLDGLQSGMAGLEGWVTPETLPGDTWGGRLVLVGIGTLLTLITQSSSAGIATALAAVHMGTISLPQALAMAIGMDVGTTATALIATIGGSTQARRTGFAHVIYNVMTGIGAFFLLGLYLYFWRSFAPGTMVEQPEIVLVAFHSTFNILGVVLVLPWTERFARLIERLFPEREGLIVSRLDPSLASEPDVAVAAAHGATAELGDSLLADTAAALRTSKLPGKARRDELMADVTAVRAYLLPLDTAPTNARTFARLTATMHALDHLERLLSRCTESERLRVVLADAELARHAVALAEALEAGPRDAGTLHAVAGRAAAMAEPFRRAAIADAASGEVSDTDAMQRVDAARWLRRVCHHAYRVASHAHAGEYEGADVPASSLPEQPE